MLRRLLIAYFTFIFLFGSISRLLAQGSLSSPDAAELHRLIQPHLPHSLADNNKPADKFDIPISLNQKEDPVIFSIPGFHSLGCIKCHKGKSLHFKAANKMRRVLAKLKVIKPELKEIPLRQYIIQSWSDSLLAPHQLAHTTFDTIRISPAAILIDGKAYQGATHLHESLHLTQSFVGLANELEAYSLNIISDPRFLLLNFPYFEDVVKTFFITNFSNILNAFYSRPVQEKLNVPQETQWFLASFNEGQLEQLRLAIAEMGPLLDEISRLNQKYPREIAYLSEQAGNPALLLEIIAANRLIIPDSGLAEETQRKAFDLFDIQMNKKDNTRLGYKINRKKEAFLFIQSQLEIKQPATHLILYFKYLKQRFVIQEGEINLNVGQDQDFNSYTLAKIKGIQKMSSYKNLSQIERDAAKKLIEEITFTLKPDINKNPKPAIK
jgi:hypothetical protein